MTDIVDHVHGKPTPGVALSILDLAEVSSMEDNTRLHDKKNLSMIDDSVEDVGYARSIVIDETNTVLAGNGTLEIAKKRGARLLVIDGDDPDLLVAVRKSNLTPAQKARYNMRDNRATDTSRNNAKAIARLVEKMPEQQLLDGIFDERSQEKLLKLQSHAQSLAPGGAEDDGTPMAGEESIRQESSVRMLPVFLTTENHPLIVRKLRALGEKVFGMTVMTDIVVAAIERGFEEWVPVEPAPLEPTEQTDAAVA